MQYWQKLQDPRWQKKRLEVLNRDGWKCVRCNAADKQLQVHHCIYSGNNPWDTSADYLMTLCAECHKERQSQEKRAKSALIKIMADNTLSIEGIVYSLENMVIESEKNRSLVFEIFSDDQLYQEVNSIKARAKAGLIK